MSTHNIGFNEDIKTILSFNYYQISLLMMIVLKLLEHKNNSASKYN